MSISLEVGPIFRTQLRNKLGVILIALQIAFTMTVMVNAVDIIQDRNAKMASPTGLDEANIFHISSFGFGESFNESTVQDEDINMIRALPGVIDAAIVSAVPAGGSGSSDAFMSEPDQREFTTNAAVYRVDEHAVTTMGLKLVAGETFGAEQVRKRSNSEALGADQVVVSLAFAQEMFPGAALEAVGKTIYDYENHGLRVIGIVEKLQSPWPNSDWIVERSVLIPDIIIDGNTTYLVRTEHGQRDDIMLEVEERLAASAHERIVRNNLSMTQSRAELYRLDGAMGKILYVVIATLMFITAMGIVGLSVFGINKRQRQIGTRRALGATRAGILRYLLLENFLVSGTGVLLGAVLSIVFNMFLVQMFDTPKLDWYFIPIGMLVLILLGQLSVLGPARSASYASPAQAISPSH